MTYTARRLDCGYRWISARNRWAPEEDPPVRLLVSNDYKLAQAPYVMTGAWLDPDTGTSRVDLAPTAHREFARLDGGEPGMLAFANRHGLLGVRRPLAVAIEAGQPVCSESRLWEGMPAGALRFVGESDESWRSAINDMREALELWDMITSNDQEQLQRRIVRRRDVCAVDTRLEITAADLALEQQQDWGEDHILYVTPAGRCVIVASRASYPDLLDEFPNGVIKPARHALRVMVSKGLASHVRPRLDLDAEHRQFALSAAPDGSLGALWLQLVDETIGVYFAAYCRWCGRPFEKSRRDKEYCSRSCKNSAGRRSRQNAENSAE